MGLTPFLPASTHLPRPERHDPVRVIRPLDLPLHPLEWREPRRLEALDRSLDEKPG